MKRTRRMWLIVVLLLLVAPVTGTAEDEEEPKGKPLLWVIEGDVPQYLFGALHVPDERITDFPSVVMKAVGASDVFVSEIPLDMASQMKAQTLMGLPKGETLSDFVGKDLYKRIKRAMPDEYPRVLLKRTGILVILSVLQLGEYAEDALTGAVVQNFKLFGHFTEASKPCEALETIEEQMSALTSLSKEEQIKLLTSSLKTVEHDQESTESSATERLMAAYIAGDEKKLLQMTLDMNAPEDKVLKAKLARTLITERNAKITKRLLARIKAAPDKSHFITFGAGHFAGDKGVLALLKAGGLKVRRLKLGDAVPKKKKPATADR